MKTKIIISSIAMLFVLNSNLDKAFSQATSSGPIFSNTQRTGSDYIGWDGSVNVPLDLRTNATGVNAQPINFYTDSIFRMIIDPAGLVGIGTNIPSAVLNVDGTNIGIDDIFRTNGDYGLDNYWHLAKNGFDLFTLASFASESNIWMGAEYGSLNHYTNVSQPINWLTGFTPRMQIYDADPSPSNGGFVGIGDFDINSTPQTITPQSLLHLYRSGNTSVYQQFSNDNTGSDSTDGFKIGITPGSIAELRQQETSPMIFYSRSAALGTTMRERIRINEGLGGDGIGNIANDTVTKISICHDGIGTNYLPQPVSLLNIGSSLTIPITQQAGNRTWMDVGTYCNFGSDNMYIGIKDNGPDRKDAVINWGDDYDNHKDSDFQDLRFIFTGWQLNTGSTDPYNHNATNGLEVARMNAHGNMGIGVGSTSTTTKGFNQTHTPKRRLDIFDDDSTHNSGNYHGGPQLRLTQALSTDDSTGVYTDFQTTSHGDLYIHPDSNLTNRRVGINIKLPGNTLEINSDSISITPGASGLRFHDLTSSSTAGSPNGKVLSLNSSGDVILVRDSLGNGTGTGDVVACTDTIRDYYVTKWLDVANKKICNSQIYDNGTNVGIGTSSPSAKLEIYNAFNKKIKIGYDNTQAFPPAGLGNLLSSVQFASGSGNWNHSIFSYSDSLDTIGNYINGNSNFNLGFLARTDMVFYQNSTQIMRLKGSGSNDGMPIVEIARGGMADRGGILNVEGFRGVGTNFLTTDATVDIHNNNQDSPGGYSIGTRIIADGTPVSGGSSGNTNFALYVRADSGTTQITIHNLANFAIWSDKGSVWNNEGAGAWDGPSDFRLKRNIVPFTDGLDVVRQINPKKFYFNGKAGTNPDNEQIGVIAQEILPVAPYTIRNYEARFEPTDTVPTPLYGFNPGSLLYVAINALKQLDSIVAVQNMRIDSLANALSQCCNLQRSSSSHIENNTDENKITVELSSENSIILNQNDPNPFAEQTTITYVIPDEVKDAKIIFYTNSGRVLKTVVINERGNGSMQVYASNLSSGIYTYSLIADNHLVDTKKMVCTK